MSEDSAVLLLPAPRWLMENDVVSVGSKEVVIVRPEGEFCVRDDLIVTL